MCKIVSIESLYPCNCPYINVHTRNINATLELLFRILLFAKNAPLFAKIRYANRSCQNEQYQNIVFKIISNFIFDKMILDFMLFMCIFYIYTFYYIISIGLYSQWYFLKVLNIFVYQKVLI